MTEQELAALTDEVTDLQNAVRDTTAKVAAIEAAREAEGRSFLKRFTVAGTALALALSLVTGLYALYDQSGCEAGGQAAGRAGRLARSGGWAEQAPGRLRLSRHAAD